MILDPFRLQGKSPLFCLFHCLEDDHLFCSDPFASGPAPAVGCSATTSTTTTDAFGFPIAAPTQQPAKPAKPAGSTQPQTGNLLDF